MSIAAEVAQALAEASAEVGDGAPLLVQLVRQPAPATPWDNAAPPAPVEYNLRALLSRFDRGQLPGTQIQDGDIRVLLEAGVVEPTTADMVRIGGRLYAIVPPVKPTAPGGTTLMWDLQCRGG